MWGLRLFEPDGGLVYRNRNMRAYFEPHGFLNTPTMPWSGVQSYFSPMQLQIVESAYAAAFNAKRVILRRLEFQHAGTTHLLNCSLLAMFGDTTVGVILYRSWPFSPLETTMFD